MNQRAKIKLQKIIKEQVEKQLNEYAIPISEFKNRCINVDYNIYSHLIKICLFEEISPESINHWKTEILSFCKPLIDIKIKGDIDKEKTATKELINAWMGENFQEFNIQPFETVYSEYKEKGLTSNQTPKECLNKNRGRIEKFYTNLISAIKNNNIQTLNNALNNFIESV